ncbi:hypothetical protein A2U01_0083996, partial [Trifolium medium]|nr:hypothetical protein [Trifolium medium]
LSAAARFTSSLYDASRPAPAALGIDGASPIVVATSKPTYYLQGPSQ